MLVYMQAHFFGEIVEEAVATEDAGYPVHGVLLTGWRFIRIENQRNALEHALEAGDLLLETAKAHGRDLVGAHASIRGGDAPLRFDQLCLEQPLEGWVER